MYRTIKYFPNLTPLRFLAAYLVVLFHVEETRKMFGLPNLTRFSLFTQGPLAVTFFFVLSGFLITYLLLREQEQCLRIDVSRFYVRRIVRIWPLYFLMVFIGLVLIPAGIKLGHVRYHAPFHSLDVAPYFLTFLPWIVNLKYGNHFLTPLWSVGVEEIYYLLWAPVVKWFRRHLLAVISGMAITKILLATWAHYAFRSALIEEVLRMLQFEAMAIGGLAAYFLFHRNRPMDAHWLFSIPAQTVLILVLLIRLFIHKMLTEVSPLYAAVFNHALFSPWLLMVIFALFILNVAANERSIIRLNWRVLDYLGDISYGIYMYHALAISLIFVPFRNKFQAAPFVQSTLLLHLLIAVATLLLAALSKKFVEDKFRSHKKNPEATLLRSTLAKHFSEGESADSRILAA
jgi:peptidoglycan/LPS O-acetylase OafA/YrhL